MCNSFTAGEPLLSDDKYFIKEKTGGRRTRADQDGRAGKNNNHNLPSSSQVGCVIVK